ncbi:MAG: alpha/beta hydrolase, partial [Methylococcaceae bacterium]|nr:alpha/beta hydrolase [Methylococcaceae bacterium]
MSLPHQIRLRDGRRLGYACYGDPAGRPLLYFHGLPSSRLEAGFMHAPALRLGIRVIAVDRPGYGRSDFQQERRLLDWPDDIRQLADALGLDRFGVLGVSGGGPYTLACAWKLAERIDRVILVAGLAPLDRPANLTAMSLYARLAFALARRSPALTPIFYGVPYATVLRHAPALAAAALRFSGCPEDRASLAGHRATALMLASLREGLRQGPAAALRDVRLYSRAWGFPLESIEIPVDLWHGTADRVVPPFHAQMMAAALPKSALNWVPGAGHYSLPISHGDQILAER